MLLGRWRSNFCEIGDSGLYKVASESCGKRTGEPAESAVRRRVILTTFLRDKTGKCAAATGTTRNPGGAPCRCPHAGDDEASSDRRCAAREEVPFPCGCVLDLARLFIVELDSDASEIGDAEGKDGHDEAEREHDGGVVGRRRRVDHLLRTCVDFASSQSRWTVFDPCSRIPDRSLQIWLAPPLGL